MPLPLQNILDYFNRIDTGYTPACLIQFDDALRSAYVNGQQYMISKGIKGTVYVTPNLIGQPDYMTLDDLKAIYNEGWALGNHTIDHTDLTSLGTVGEIEQKIQSCTDWLLTNGFSRAAHHAAYPFGMVNENVETAMRNLGMKTGRTTTSRTFYLPWDNFFQLPVSMELLTSTTLDAGEAAINAAIDKNMTVIIFGHRVLDTPTGRFDWSTSNFKALVDYIVLKKIKCLTIDEWYRNERGHTSP